MSYTVFPSGLTHTNPRRPDFYSTQYYTDILLEFLEGDHGDDSPFFAYLSYTATHDPLHTPKEYIDKYLGMYDSGWDDLRQQRLQACHALLSEMDKPSQNGLFGCTEFGARILS